MASLAFFCTLSSCKQESSEVSAPKVLESKEPYSETSGQIYTESEFSQWMSKADQQIAYEKRDPKTYFAYTEGRSEAGFQQFRHVVRPLPVETHSEWGVYWGLSHEEFYLIDLKLQKAGFERENLQVFEDGTGNAFYQSVWLKKK